MFLFWKGCENCNICLFPPYPTEKHENIQLLLPFPVNFWNVEGCQKIVLIIHCEVCSFWTSVNISSKAPPAFPSKANAGALQRSHEFPQDQVSLLNTKLHTTIFCWHDGVTWPFKLSLYFGLWRQVWAFLSHFCQSVGFNVPIDLGFIHFGWPLWPHFSPNFFLLNYIYSQNYKVGPIIKVKTPIRPP